MWAADLCSVRVRFGHRSVPWVRVRVWTTGLCLGLGLGPDICRTPRTHLNFIQSMPRLGNATSSSSYSCAGCRGARTPQKMCLLLFIYLCSNLGRRPVLIHADLSGGGIGPSPRLAQRAGKGRSAQLWPGRDLPRGSWCRALLLALAAVAVRYAADLRVQHEPRQLTGGGRVQWSGIGIGATPADTAQGGPAPDQAIGLVLPHGAGSHQQQPKTAATKSTAALTMGHKDPRQ